MQSSTLTAPNSDSVTNTAKFFYGDTVIECLRSRYYAFGDYVVCVRRKAHLFTPASLQQTPGSLGTLALQLCSEPSMSVPDCLHNRTGVGIPFAVNRYVDNTHVYPKPPFSFIFGFIRLRKFRRLRSVHS